MSSSLLDRMTEEANALTEQERRILAERLLKNEQVDSKKIEPNDVPFEGRGNSDEVVYRKREYQWLREHRDEYAGEHLALQGDQLIAHGKNLRQVIKEAKEAGAKAPFFVYIEAPDELPLGGW